MKIGPHWLSALLALGLAACNGAEPSSELSVNGRMDGMIAGAPPPALSVAAASADMERMEVDKSAADSPTVQQFVQQEPGGGNAPDPTAARQIAYDYAFAFSVPTLSMEGLLNAQKAACEAAGPSKCYVVSSSINGLGQDYASGVLAMRAAPDWVAAFQAGLPSVLEPFEAKLESSNETSEDLTVQMIDTTARLNSNKTLRDRLVKLLADRPGKLSDLLEIERELARVQAEIDSTESYLAAMRLRIAMSSVTLSYQPRYSAVSESIWRPLSDATAGFLPNIVASLAIVVGFIAGILPWIVIALIAFWLLRMLWSLNRRRRKAKAEPSA